MAHLHYISIESALDCDCDGTAYNMKAYKERTEILHPSILSSEAPKMTVLCHKPQSGSGLSWREFIGIE